MELGFIKFLMIVVHLFVQSPGYFFKIKIDTLFFGGQQKLFCQFEKAVVRPLFQIYKPAKNNLSISKKLYLKTSFEVNSSCVGCLLQTNVNIWEAKLIGGACIIVTATTTTATADFCRIVVVNVQQQVGRNSIYRLRSKRDIIRLRSINS